MDQGANALDMITKFTRNQSLVQQDPSYFDVAVDHAVGLLGRKSGTVDVSR